MWGTWFNVTLGIVVVALLLVIAIATAWAPIFAIVVVAIAVAVAIPLMSRRRRRSEADADVSGGADGGPASGEGAEDDAGSPEAAHRPREESSSELTEGVWGERREA